MSDLPAARSPLEAITRERFLGHTYSQERVILLTLSQLYRFPNNPNRVSWMMINESAVDIRVGSGPDTSQATGWLLAANGGVLSQDWAEDGEAVGYDIYLFPVTTIGQVRFREVIRT